MTRRRIVALVIVAASVALLAGAPTPTVTDPTHADEPAYPPGIGARGIENASALLFAHFDTLNATGYRDRSVYRYVGHGDEGDRIVANRTIVLTASPAMETVRVRTIARHSYLAAPAVSRRDTWSNRSTAVSRVRCPGNGTVLSHDGPSDRIALTFLRTPIHGHLSAGDYEITGVNHTANGDLFTLHADRPSYFGRSTQDLTAFEATLVVDSAGRIRRFRSRETSPDDDGREQVYSLRYDLLDVGVPGVSRPAWSGRALRSEDDGCPVPASVGRPPGVLFPRRVEPQP